MSVPRRYPQDMVPPLRFGVLENIAAAGGPPKPPSPAPLTLENWNKIANASLMRSWQSPDTRSPHDIQPVSWEATPWPNLQAAPDLPPEPPRPSETPSRVTETPAVTSGHFPDYDHYIGRLADAQRYKLRINAHKGDLGSIPVPRLMEMMRGEMAELEEAIQRDSEIEVILECADIMNFALGCAISAIRRMNGE